MTENMPDETQSDTSELTSVFPTTDLDLREGADACYKCTSCDVSCPVATVDDSFPGPKFQGPEQWRLTRKSDEGIDSSIMDCSNCFRCESACPSDVPLTQMHNTARAKYVEQSQSRISRRYLRNWLLANYETAGWIGSRVPRISNLILNSFVFRWLGERVLGITRHRDFPAFAGETFRSWWESHNTSPKDEAQTEKTIVYFHGCYSNYNTPDVAKSTVRVLEEFGYNVIVPPQRCSGTPMLANGMMKMAQSAAETNIQELSGALKQGRAVVTSCTSCSFAIRKEYPELFDLDGVSTVAENTFDAIEFLRVHENLDEVIKDLSPAHSPLVYHAPCHARNQGIHRQIVDLFAQHEHVHITDVGDSCSGISGTYGWKAEHYDTSMAIGSEMFSKMHAAPGTIGITECPTCAMQMNHGTGYAIQHPMQLIEQILVE